MAKIKITQVKSGIDRSERQKRTLVALGLRKMHYSVEVEATPQIVGMVQAVHHLVKVEKESTTGKYEVCAPHSLANVAARVAGGTK
jgi:large subunit ribosomal protein L30